MLFLNCKKTKTYLLIMKLIVETARYEQHLYAALSDQHPLRNRLTCPLLADKKKKTSPSIHFITWRTHSFHNVTKCIDNINEFKEMVFAIIFFTNLRESQI